jgi:Trp operon repressor
MSTMSDLMIDIQEELEKGELSFTEIATKYEVPVAWVTEINQMVQEYNSEENA